MPYSVLKSFERGIDARRLIDCTEPGALLDAKDCHITRGGEIEKRAAFVVAATLPAGTMGFYATDGPTYHVWGQAASAPAGMPANAVYHSIPDPSTPSYALEYILSVEEFSGKLYVVARYADGKTIHWWNDVAVREFDPPPVVILPEDPDDPPIEVEPPPPPVPGAKPSVTVTYLHTTQTSPFNTRLWSVLLVPPSQLMNLATPIVATTATTDDGVPVIAAAGVGIPLGDGSGSNIAASVANYVNSFTSTPEVLAVASGNKVTFTINDASPTYNGWSICTMPFTGFQAISFMAPLSGGIAPVGSGGGGLFGSVTPAIEPFADGDPKPLKVLGSFATAHNLRMYAVNEAMLNFSMERNPDRWDDQNPTAGIIDHSMIAKSKPVLVGACDYQDGLAVFGLRHIFIWRTDPAPAQFFKKQALHRTGTASPHSITPYSDNEVMYLDRSGIRSLRTRTGVDVAFSGDFGNLIDRLVTDKMKTMTLVDRFRKVWGEVEPNSGRLWMAFGDVIFVLSYYPDTNIAGWTRYDASAHPIEFLNANYEGIFWRSGNNIIAYAGVTGDVYDSTEALVRVPYIDAGKPATTKNWTGIDLAISGTWQIKASFDPTQPTALDLIANLTKSTYAQQKIAVNGQSPSVSLEMRTSFVGPARVGNATVHFTDVGAD
jgi:hypothetical protein